MLIHCCKCCASVSRRAWGLVEKLVPRIFVEQLSVQILVVVASSQMRILRIDVEKGSTLTMFGHGLAGPENQG